MYYKSDISRARSSLTGIACFDVSLGILDHTKEVQIRYFGLVWVAWPSYYLTSV